MPSNLPPGVTESMIPGNRPEDVEDEAFWEMLTAKLEADWSPESRKARAILLEDPYIIQAIEIARDMGYEKGFGEAQAEAELEMAERENRLVSEGVVELRMGEEG